MSKRILVTGSSRGLGKAIATQLASDGWQLTLHGRTPSAALEATYNEINDIGPRPPQCLTFDVACASACREALEADMSANGAYYGVVLNAGISRDGAFPALSDEDWYNVIQTSLNGFYHVLQPLTMPMLRLKKGGRIVTIASVSGQIGNRGQVNYSAAKGGIIAASKALALELAKRRVTVNCVAPGLIETDMVSEELKQQILPHIPLQRLGQTQDVAALVAFLCSDAASYITRQVMGVNGGLA